jgi:uncharacterized membrane protein YphA (DoxX/SURF4 family)
MRYALTILRVSLAGVFIVYGTAKLLGGQFIFGKAWVIDSRTTDRPTLVWSFYGYSPIYGRLIGLMELGPAILLLIPRMRLLGALALFAVSANITVMDFCFDFPPVKYISLILTAACAMLIVADWRKLRLMFWSDRQLGALERAESNSEFMKDDSPHSPRRTWVAWILPLAVILPLVIFSLNIIGDVLSSEPPEAGLANCMEHGWKREDLQLLSWKGTSWSGFNRRAQVTFQTIGTKPDRTIHVQVYKPHGFASWQVIDYQEE